MKEGQIVSGQPSSFFAIPEQAYAEIAEGCAKLAAFERGSYESEVLIDRQRPTSTVEWVSGESVYLILTLLTEGDRL